MSLTLLGHETRFAARFASQVNHGIISQRLSASTAVEAITVPVFATVFNMGILTKDVLETLSAGSFKV
jgi:hypothetical protein